MLSAYHVPVLLKESVDGLAVKPDGVYVDVTFGGGGHSREILTRLGSRGRLIAFDQDGDAEQNGAAMDDRRLTLVRGNFRFLRSYLRCHMAEEVDGIIGDLGVSWRQLDAGERGFSFRFDAPLDMRMNRQGGRTAATLLDVCSVQELSRIFAEYGELNNAHKAARLVDAARQKSRIATTGELVEALRPALPPFDEHKYLARVFQALRIEVNHEMQALEQMLEQAAKVVKKGGRLSVITYHSLEDRMVKNFIRSGSASGNAEKDVFGSVHAPFEAVNKKVALPGEEEVRQNPRARSAKLRIAQKVA
ncbi:MAG: 16S rRNA (cytosine(1402)-N(4))-methyltransferase RsmH [Prevotellaceae bacterium]|jgi:16S rRNA (cytosine1402-N4)-methyltransferase|nr:16S rRNA (cytosine(1402)-N(4))-methyltransferase RsmH [Prevotellaceae bacterium]